MRKENALIIYLKNKINKKYNLVNNMN